MSATHVPSEACPVFEPFLALLTRVDLELVWSVVVASSSSFFRLHLALIWSAILRGRAEALLIDIGDIWRRLGLPLAGYWW